MDNRPIGLMDSGLGGLSVGRILQRQMPNESLVFLGDQGRFPYGTRPQSQVRQYGLQIARFLASQHVKMVIIACNTMTAAALPNIQQDLKIPVLGVIEPGAQAVATAPVHHRVGVIATDSTTKDGAYVRQIHRLDPDIEVIPQAAQQLVSIVEHGQAGTPAAQQSVDKALATFVKKPVDALVLGCTHFPFLTDEIRHTLGPDVLLIDPAVETVRNARRVLASRGELASRDHHPETTLYTTGEASSLAKMAAKLLTRPGDHINHIDAQTLEEKFS